ncbi:MAG: hypothetical protein Q9194_000700 [Teloschistes cf. exilis]
METYPTEELEWVATTAFNRAVEFYSTSQDKTCRRWAEKAISLAELNNDGEQIYGFGMGPVSERAFVMQQVQGEDQDLLAVMEGFSSSQCPFSRQ